MKDGAINLDTTRGKRFGFTSDRFAGYLWKVGDEIFISAIESKRPGQGHLSALFKAIEAAGYRIAVPIPFPRMKAILQAKGFCLTAEPHPEITHELVEVWRKPLQEAPHAG